jgi:hypothetical protein
MAFSYYTYTGDGTTTQFPVAFGYIRREHVLATVAGAPATFTFVNSTTIQMDAPPANGAVVRVYRQTPLTAPLVNFTDGSTLVAADLDTNALQSIYTQQELDDSLVDGLAGVIPNGDKGDITTSVGGSVWTIDNGAVTEAKVGAGAITETKVGAGAITETKVGAGAITETKVGAGAVTTAKLASVIAPTVSSLNGGPLAGTRNRIINGDMRIDQRNAGASVTATPSATYIVDRFVAGMVGANGTMQRISSGRTDFPFALRLTGTASTTTCWTAQLIESFNCADLVGQSVTISFYAAASALTSVSMNLSYANSSDNFGSITSISSQAKTITSTITQYAVTVSNLPAGAANGLYLEFVPGGNLGTGTFTITGVQLETGTVATPFERRSYGQELALCQRYFCKSYEIDVTPGSASINFGNPNSLSATGLSWIACNVSFPVTMRTNPSVSIYRPSTGAISTVEETGEVNPRTVSGIEAGASGIGLLIIASNSPAAATPYQFQYTASAEL